MIILISDLRDEKIVMKRKSEFHSRFHKCEYQVLNLIAVFVSEIP